MEKRDRNAWVPIAIAAIVVALLLLCLLLACGCTTMMLLMRDRDTSGYESPYSYSYSTPAPPAAATVVPQRIGGATITYVEPGSPADTAGLQRGDVITAVDGVPINANNDLADAIGAYRPGDTVTIAYQQWHTADVRDVDVKLGQNPSDASRPYLGIEYEELPSQDEGLEDEGALGVHGRRPAGRALSRQR